MHTCNGNCPGPVRSHLTYKSKTPFLACPRHNSSPVQARITKLIPGVQRSRLRFLFFWRRFTSKAKLNLNVKMSLWLVSPLYNSYDCVDCSVPNVSQSPSSAQTYIPRRLHGLDCFSVNYLHVYWSRQARIFGRLTSLLLLSCFIYLCIFMWQYCSTAALIVPYEYNGYAMCSTIHSPKEWLILKGRY